MSSATVTSTINQRIVSRRVRLEAVLTYFVDFEAMLNGPAGFIQDCSQKYREMFLLHIESERDLKGQPYDQDSALAEWYSSATFAKLLTIQGHASKQKIMAARET